jgi:very-short-patch-repair endonuclease
VGRKPDIRRAARDSKPVSGRGDRFVASIVPVADVLRVSGTRGGGDPLAQRVARRQLNLITTQQLLAAGVTETMITVRRRRALLHRVHRGVYLFGTDVMLPAAPELAAVLACGEDALAGRRSALSLLAVIPQWHGAVEITLSRSVKRSGISVHRVTRLEHVDRDTHRGVPIVSPALALLEFAAVATGDELERAIAEAYALKLVNEPALRNVLNRYPGIAGVVALRAELDRVGGPQLTKREAARRMKLLIRHAGLPPPRTEVRLAGFVADFFWAQFRLIVEADGYQYHGHRYAFERDRKRDQAHIAAGYKVLRFTWRQLTEEPYRVIGVIAIAIGAATERRAAAA